MFFGIITILFVFLLFMMGVIHLLQWLTDKNDMVVFKELNNFNELEFLEENKQISEKSARMVYNSVKNLKTGIVGDDFDLTKATKLFNKKH